MIHSPTSIDWLRPVRMFAFSFASIATFASVYAFAEPTAAERGLAAALFDQGRTLMGDGRVDEACVKLAESQRLDPGGGTLLNLALCHEKQGKIATAWTEFREARSIAKKDNRADRESAADAEIAKLESQVSKLSVVVLAESKVPGMTIEIDGLPLPEATWGTQFPVDPGMRTVVVKAPGYREWKSTVEIGTTARTADINIPKLEKAEASAGAIPNDKPPPTGSSAPIGSAPQPDAPMSSMRKGGFVVGGIGLALVGVGAIAGGAAIRKDKAADAVCGETACTTQQGLDDAQTAFKLANASTAMFAVGLAGLAVGTVLIVVAPKRAPAQASLSIGPQFVSVTGKF